MLTGAIVIRQSWCIEAVLVNARKEINNIG